MYDKTRTARFLEVALLINNADMHDGTLKKFHEFCKRRGKDINDVEAISAFLRDLCYEFKVDTTPIAYLLDDNRILGTWLEHLETMVIPYLVEMNVVKKNA